MQRILLLILPILSDNSIAQKFDYKNKINNKKDHDIIINSPPVDYKAIVITLS